MLIEQYQSTKRKRKEKDKHLWATFCEKREQELVGKYPMLGSVELNFEMIVR